MFRSIVYSICLIGAVTAAVVPELPNDASVQVLIVDDISKLKDLKEGAQLIPIEGVQEKIQIQSVDGIQERTQMRYNMGNRVGGDRLVSREFNNHKWSLPMDLQLRIDYPTSGQGARVTFVDIVVDQSSNQGKAYVLSGGIGQRSIVIIVEAYNTFWFNYTSSIYGI